MAKTHASRGSTKSDDVEAVVGELVKWFEVIVLKEREVWGYFGRAGLPSRHNIESVNFTVWVPARKVHDPVTRSAGFHLTPLFEVD